LPLINAPDLAGPVFHGDFGYGFEWDWRRSVDNRDGSQVEYAAQSLFVGTDADVDFFAAPTEARGDIALDLRAQALGHLYRRDAFGGQQFPVQFDNDFGVAFLGAEFGVFESFDAVDSGQYPVAHAF